ncbi:MAG TPA: LUD domain-containing protein [Actinocrinis sp.]|jgi:L-lactate dehydrogenase complex protein LldG|uniref:LutC/YkgG family protein n=1 Tax=Actinocrinis sp. TaxID=1920516 RepID=UPI002DDCFB2F|nr:LUD domain-containing protein [Actinocrinis sp.]HEV3173818.1 LUD domain-containing protein [Actinocrinis sp.]
MSARDEILGRIRTALADRPSPEAVPRAYRAAGSMPADMEQFVDRLVDYRATVHRCAADAEAVAAAVAEILGGRGFASVVVPDGFPQAWLPQSVEAVREPVTNAQLDEVGAVLTTCAVAVAETGTIVLDAGPGQGPRALTLVPDYHLVVVRADQVRAIVPDAVAALTPERPLTWISGPSATSDIELRRVEGVHGPRTLDVLIAAAAADTLTDEART